MKDFYEKAVRESPFQTFVIKQGERRGWLAQKLISQSANGWPDIYLLRKGRVILIETKTPFGELSGNQILRHKEIRDHGGEVYCFNHNDRAAVIALLH